MWESLLPAYSGNQFPSSKNAKVKSKKMSPRRVNANMNMSMDKPIALIMPLAKMEQIVRTFDNFETKF